MGAEQRSTSNNQSLATDLSLMDTVQNKRSSLERDIMTLRATPQTVISWYFNHDPLKELDAYRNAVALTTGSRRDIAEPIISDSRHKTISEAGAAILMMNIAFPELNGLIGEAYTDRFAEIIQRNTTENKREDKNIIIGTLDLVAFTLYTLHQSSGKRDLYTRTELEHMKIAADLLIYASIANVQEPTDVTVKIDNRTRKMTREGINRLYALDIYQSVADYGLSQKADEISQLIGLESLMSYATVFLNAARLPTVRKRAGLSQQKQLLGRMIDAVEHIFVEHPERLNDENRGRYQGKLHELMWFIDMQFYIETAHKYYIQLYPAQRAEDQPHIEYPSINRGFDYRLRDARNDQFILVQLKSGKKGHQYHPLIKVLKDPQMIDYNPEQLREKVASYRKAIMADFADPAISAHLLPSICQAATELETNSHNLLEYVNQNQDLGGDFDTRPMSRQQRRYYQRQLRKMQEKTHRQLERQHIPSQKSMTIDALTKVLESYYVPPTPKKK